MQEPAKEEYLSLPDSMVSGHVAQLRLLTGLLQGLMLFWLYHTGSNKLWPATEPYVFIPLMMVMAFVPVIFISSLGHLSKRVIFRWLFSVSLIIVVLAIYDIWRVGYVEYANNADAQLYPSPMLVFFTVMGLFIAHALIFSAASDFRLIARYVTYFEVAWKLGIQLCFAGLFIGILWAVLFLGAGLFALVKIDFLGKLLEQPWFSIPVTTFAFSFALHITDVKPGIVRGIRTLLLVLMSWLLPVVTLMVTGFIVSLPFTGLEPLWATRNATAVLLGASAVLIVLINTAFQNGEVSTQLSRVLRVSARLAALLLAPLIVIAMYSLGLRVVQYGWTTDRMIAASCLLVGMCYAAGYAWAASEKQVWLNRIAPTNIVAAMLVLSVLLALFTPLADPARISVNSQVSRLLDGKIRPADFDFDYLKFDGARYGMQALTTLKETWQGEDMVLLREKIDTTHNKKFRWDKELVVDIKDNLNNITIWPRGRELPASFVDQTWDKNNISWQVPDCLKSRGKQCDVFIVDLNRDSHPEILVLGRESYMQPQVFTRQTDNSWKLAGNFTGGNDQCRNNIIDALKSNSFRLVDPAINDVEVNGRIFRFVPVQENYIGCQKD